MAIERLRGRKLQEQRLRVWINDPKCVRCGLITAFPSGFELDHRTALTNGGTNDDDNMQILCVSPCHEEKTNEDLGHKPKVQVGLDGFPVEKAEATTRTARWRRVERLSK